MSNKTKSDDLVRAKNLTHTLVVFSNRKSKHTIHIVGGGIMGLVAAIQLAEQSRRDGIECKIRVYESGAFGGGKDEWAASPRCQLWLHTAGQLYAKSQPAVVLELQKSTQWLRDIASQAFNFPPAWSIERICNDEPKLADCYSSLGIPHELVPLDVFQYWYSKLHLPPNCRVYRITDGTMDIQHLGFTLMRKATDLGVELVPSRVEGFSLQGDKVSSLAVNNYGKIAVGLDDQVVLACGARIRPLLADVGITIPGLRLFQCHLVATDSFGLNALFVMHAVANCVPHYLNDGRLINIFGNNRRVELLPEADHQRLEVDDEAVEILCQDVEQWFGLCIPKDNRLAWFGVKTEIIPGNGMYSQGYRVQQVSGLSNTWLAIPGKLSQSPACARELTRKLLGQWLGDLVARPIWETPGIAQKE